MVADIFTQPPSPSHHKKAFYGPDPIMIMIFNSIKNWLDEDYDITQSKK